MGRESRETFLEDLNTLIADADFTLLATVIDKYKLKKEFAQETHVYHLAMELGLEKLYHFLQSRNQQDRLIHIIREARGKVEDRALEVEFSHVCSGHNNLKKALPFQLVIADKKANSEGLQFADLDARPVGLSVVRPGQTNRAFQILEKKLHKNHDGEAAGYGFHLYPVKSEKRLKKLNCIEKKNGAEKRPKNFGSSSKSKNGERKIPILHSKWTNKLRYWRNKTASSKKQTNCLNSKTNNSASSITMFKLFIGIPKRPEMF